MVTFAEGNLKKTQKQKKNYDSLTKTSMRVTATKISNPILASLITAFIREVIWDCLHNNHKLGGPKGVVSVTTDRFITNIGDL